MIHMDDLIPRHKDIDDDLLSPYHNPEIPIISHGMTTSFVVSPIPRMISMQMTALDVIL